MRRLQELRPAQTGATAAPAASEARLLADDIAAFPGRAATLSPDAAAQEWFSLFKRRNHALSRAGAEPGLRQRLDTAHLFDIVPGPASWPALRRLAEAPDAFSHPSEQRLFLFLADTLNNDEAAQWADLRVLGGDLPAPRSPSASSAPSDPPLSWQEYYSLGARLSLSATNAGEVEHFWRRIAAPRSGEPSGELPGFASFPDFVSILGADRAAVLLRDILPTLPVSFQRVQGEETCALATKIALESVGKLAVAPWYLTHHLQGADLYSALAKKFGPPRQDAEADTYYVLAQLLAGRNDAAVAAARKIPVHEQYPLKEGLHRIAEAGRGAEVRDFLQVLLAASPESDLWEFYVPLAAQTGQSDHALAFVRETVARPGISPEGRQAAGAVLYQALLANDRVDEGIAALRAEIAAPAGNEDLPKQAEIRLDLARAGRALKRDDLEKEGLDAALALLAAPTGNEDNVDGSGSARNHASAVRLLVDYLVATGREPEAARLQSDEIVRLVRAKSKTQEAQDAFRGFLNPYADGTMEIRQGLVCLATIYDRANRPADVLALLEEAPCWSARDLVELAPEKASVYRRAMPSLALVAARALAAEGRTAEARAALDEALRVDGGGDGAYALLLQLDAAAANNDTGARLGALYRRDQFEERPLIWKASWLLGRHQVAEAEAACRQAIAVDPSDGQTGKGDRMRAYAVMAEICDAKNDPAQAALYRNIVGAIRLSEDADDLYDAHLVTRAVALYEEALGRFSDAYCIQSRIARQLAALGRLEEAAPHYRRAFELMPSSFGRMESHCFGCERAFEGKTAADLAEETFRAMMAKDPGNPRLPYLLGYLRDEQGRYAEALDGFRRAAALDPDYINAWKKIVEMNEHLRVPPALFDQAALNLLRLDPARRHTYLRADDLRDLSGLWAAIEAANREVPPPPLRLLPLAASAKEWETLLAAAKASHPGLDFEAFAENYRFGRRESRQTPARFLMENELVRSAFNHLP